MMFLEYFIKGAWFVTLGTYLIKSLNASGMEVANIFATQSLGAVFAPFLWVLSPTGILMPSGYFQHYISLELHYFTGCRKHRMRHIFILCICLFYGLHVFAILIQWDRIPHIEDAKKYFPGVRVWGTIGWICSGLVISYLFRWDAPESIQAGALHNTFIMGAVCSLLLAVFSLALPKTPPQVKLRDEKFDFGKAIGLDALKLLKQRSFLIFL
jgi:hypothetical protein